MISFSIIVPTFNSEKTIGRCLNSILHQKFLDFQILILDNDSSDGTRNVVNSFSDSRINFITESDFGVYDAMNKGLRMAKGQWLYFMGSDDFFYDHFVLENIYKYILNTSLPVIYGNVKIIGETGWARDGEVYAGFFSKNRMLRKAICHQAIFYKKEFLFQHNLSFNLKYFVSADWDFNLRCRRISNFKYVDLIIAVFEAGGISSIKKDSFLQEIHYEFSDMLPSRFEIVLKRLGKMVISFFR